MELSREEQRSSGQRSKKIQKLSVVGALAVAWGTAVKTTKNQKSLLHAVHPLPPLLLRIQIRTYSREAPEGTAGTSIRINFTALRASTCEKVGRVGVCSS